MKNINFHISEGEIIIVNETKLINNNYVNFNSPYNNKPYKGKARPYVVIKTRWNEKNKNKKIKNKISHYYIAPLTGFKDDNEMLKINKNKYWRNYCLSIRKGKKNKLPKSSVMKIKDGLQINRRDMIILLTNNWILPSKGNISYSALATAKKMLILINEIKRKEKRLQKKTNILKAIEFWNENYYEHTFTSVANFCELFNKQNKNIVIDEKTLEGYLKIIN